MIKVRFYEHKRAGRTVGIQFYGGEWQVMKWDDLPTPIQTLLVALGEYTEDIDVEEVPWKEEWQRGE